jgi:hypothetical protein
MKISWQTHNFLVTQTLSSSFDEVDVKVEDDG